MNEYAGTSLEGQHSDELHELTYPVEGVATLTLTERAIRAVAQCPTTGGTVYGPGVVKACRAWVRESDVEERRMEDARRRFEALAEHRLAQGLPAMEWHEVPFGDGVALEETPESHRRYLAACRRWVITTRRRWRLWWVSDATWESIAEMDGGTLTSGLCWSQRSALREGWLAVERFDEGADS